MKPIFAIFITLLVNSPSAFASHKKHEHKGHHSHSHHGSDDAKPKLKSKASLGLSPWELHVLSDLYFEINLLACPEVSKLNTRGFKRFAAHKVSSTPADTELMNPQFQAVYHDLVRCLENLGQKPHIPHGANGKSSDAEIVDQTAHSEIMTDLLALDKSRVEIKKKREEQKDNTVKVPKSISTATSKDSSANVEENVAATKTTDSFSSSSSSSPATATAKPPAKSQSWITKTFNWIRNLFWDSDEEEEQVQEEEVKPEVSEEGQKRSKREAEEKDGLPETVQKPVEAKEKPDSGKSHKDVFKRRAKIARADLRQMFSMLAEIVIKKCPAKHKPNSNFVAQSVKEITDVVSRDSHGLVSAVDTYFVKHGMWEQVTKCHREQTGKLVEVIPKTKKN